MLAFLFEVHEARVPTLMPRKVKRTHKAVQGMEMILQRRMWLSIVTPYHWIVTFRHAAKRKTA